MSTSDKQNTNLAEDENILSEVAFTTSENKSNQFILTNKRLIILWKNAQENFPLSKITSIGIYREKNWSAILNGLILMLASSAMWKFDHSSILLAGSAVGMMLASIILFIAGVIGTSSVMISYIGGSKKYDVEGANKNLMTFMDLLNHRLS